MSNVITYDIWIFSIIWLCTLYGQFLPKLVCLRRTILPAAFYNHCLPFECPFECPYHALTICHNYIWRMRSQNYMLLLSQRSIKLKSRIWTFSPPRTRVAWLMNDSECFAILLNIHCKLRLLDLSQGRSMGKRLSWILDATIWVAISHFPFHLLFSRGLDVNKRTVTTNFYSLKWGITFSHLMTHFLSFLIIIFLKNNVCVLNLFRYSSLVRN